MEHDEAQVPLGFIADGLTAYANALVVDGVRLDAAVMKATVRASNSGIHMVEVTLRLASKDVLLSAAEIPDNVAPRPVDF